MAKTNVTFTNFAAKKLLGKSQVRPSLTDAEEIFPSNVSMPGAGVFAETIPREPGTDFFTLYSASAGAPATVERVYFDLVAIGDSVYDAGLEDSAEGGDSAQGSTTHAYYLKLPSNYETTSSNPNRGTGNFVNDKRLYLSRGGLQLVPPFTTDAGLPGASGTNKYFVEVFTGDPTNPSNKISETSAIDWQFDYYSGIVFIQDSASAAPVTASAYLYVGKYLDEKLTDLSASGGGTITALNNKVANRLTTIGATTTELDGEANLTFDGSQMTVIGKLSVGEIDSTGALLDITGSGDELMVHVREAGSSNASFAITGKNFSPAANAGKIVTSLEFSSSVNVSASAYFGDGSNLTGILTYNRRAVSTTITASVLDQILGVSGAAPIDIRLPSAADYAAGQYFTVKDESGAANTKNITIRASGSQTIDGQTSIILESPHAAVNIYSDGTSKFFIY
jgi:hypothetical protein